MYDCFKDKITKGRETFPLLWIISENLLHFGSWISAGYLLWYFWQPAGMPVLAIIWILLVIVIQVMLKKHNCSGCYYYDKWCHLGWGKISSLMFKRDSGNPKIGMMLSFFYIIPPIVILIISIIIGIVEKFGIEFWIGVVTYFILNAITFPIRKKGCAECTMRKACPGSASKS